MICGIYGLNIKNILCTYYYTSKAIEMHIPQVLITTSNHSNEKEGVIRLHSQLCLFPDGGRVTRGFIR